MSDNNKRNVEVIKDEIKDELFKSAYKQSQSNPEIPLDVIVGEVFSEFLEKAKDSKDKQ